MGNVGCVVVPSAALVAHVRERAATEAGPGEGGSGAAADRGAEEAAAALRALCGGPATALGRLGAASVLLELQALALAHGLTGAHVPQRVALDAGGWTSDRGLLTAMGKPIRPALAKW
jgi:hypothetical protein